MVIDSLTENDNLKDLWKDYQNKNNYAKDIDFEDTVDAIKIIVNILEETLVVA